MLGATNIITIPEQNNSEVRESLMEPAALKLGTYLFNCRLLDDAKLPRFKGSTFRGVLGHSLKRSVCPFNNKACESCPLLKSCLYPKVFEPVLDVEANNLAPHPYLIEPELSPERDYIEGDTFNYRLLLFGDFNAYLTSFIYAAVVMGELGIGSSVKRKRARFNVESVYSENRPVFVPEVGIIKQEAGFELLKPQIFEESGVTCRQLKVEFETPFRVKRGNNFSAQVPFHVLIRAALRRVSALYSAFAGGEPALDYRGLVQKSETIVTTEENVSWYDWERYSSRQDSRMLMGGIVGSAVYRGELTQFIPLIRFAEKVHVGKQTTFGLGKIRVTEIC